jgi:hypothetical protein
MAIPPVVQTTPPESGATVPSAIINIGHVESGTLAADNGAAPPVNYFGLQRGTLVTKDSGGQYLPTLYSGLAAQGPVNIIAVAGAQVKILSLMKIGDVVSFFQPDGTLISAAHNVTAVGAADFTVDGAAVTIPAGGGIVSRDGGTYTGNPGTGVLLDGEWTQVGVSGVPATLGQPIYADQGAQILLSGTIDPDYVPNGTTEALALLPSAMLQVSRPAA